MASAACFRALFLFSHALSLAKIVPTSVEYSTVFHYDSEGYRAFRIPGIAGAADGTLVAFAEGRVPLDRGPYGNASFCYGQLASTRDGDCVDKDIVYKLSKDGGHTWSSLIVLARCNRSTFHCDPNLVLDSSTGKLWLNYYTCQGYKPLRQCFPVILVSSDHGRTFNTHYAFSGSRGTWFAGGLGGGIQQRVAGTHQGRLLFPDDGRGCVYSDDAGETWQSGMSLENYNGFLDNQIAELSNGSVVMIIRHGGLSSPFRARSDDGGLTWTEPEEMREVQNNDCQVSVISFASSPGALLMSHPFMTEHLKPPAGRQNLTLSVSVDNATTWRAILELTPRPSAYSALVDLGDWHVGCLFEGGHWGVVPIDYSDIRFAMVTLQSMAKVRS